MREQIIFEEDFLNEAFKTFTKADRRVIIAEDVIKQVNARVYTPKNAGYVDFIGKADRYQYMDETRNLSIKENFDKVKCEVCMLGACMMSIVHFQNNMTFDEITNWREEGVKTSEMLQDYFSLEEIYILESLFEGKDTGYVAVDIKDPFMIGNPFQESEDKYGNYFEKFVKKNTATNRVLKVMNFIIEEKGKRFSMKKFMEKHPL